MKKTVIQSAIADLPETFHLDQLVQKLIVIEQIEKGRDDMRMGRVHTQEQVEEHFRKRWAGQ